MNSTQACYCRGFNCYVQFCETLSTSPISVTVQAFVSFCVIFRVSMSETPYNIKVFFFFQGFDVFR